MKGSWVVELKCVVRKEVICADCTEEEAAANPWDHAQDEVELDQSDWEVLSIKPNE